MERDPLWTGAAVWQEAAQTAAQTWSGDLTITFLGVDMVRTLEYAIVTQINQAYLADAQKGEPSA